jgi:hypothetical protein
VTLIDFDLAAVPDLGWLHRRGGIDVYQAPEIALARLERRALPPPTPASEQYAIAATLYLLLTGALTHRFSLQEDEMLRQVADEAPLPFARHGFEHAAAIERCVLRGLEKSPERRFESLSDFLGALRAAHARSRRRSAPRRHVARDAEAFTNGVLARLKVPGELFERGLRAPTASAAYGAAGLAYGLLRLARSRGDGELLASADLWSARAIRELDDERAVWSEELGITPEVFGRASLYHHASGVHAVHALIAHARGDDALMGRAVDAFVAASEPAEFVDLAFGRCGLLLGCAMLVDALPARIDPGPLDTLGRELLAGVWRELERLPSLGEPAGTSALGAAHGWSGYLYAILRWCASAGAPSPDGLLDRVEQLAALTEPAGRGLRWPRHANVPADDSLLTASWCNGAAGHVLLFTLAHDTCGDERFDELASRAAWHAYDHAPDAGGELCCGLAGRAYALLSRYRHTGDSAWLARARALGTHAVASPGVPEPRRDSLLHGDIGIALLAEDLAQPEHAAMPLVEAEGWMANGLCA